VGDVGGERLANVMVYGDVKKVNDVILFCYDERIQDAAKAPSLERSFGL
jgi:hypothetical protein